MDESIGFLVLLPVLVASIWLLDYSGSSGLASAQMSAAAQRGADIAAERIADQRPTELALELATDTVNAAAIGVCNTASPRYEVTANVVAADGNQVVVVRVTCPLLTRLTERSPTASTTKTIAVSEPFSQVAPQTIQPQTPQP